MSLGGSSLESPLSVSPSANLCREEGAFREPGKDWGEDTGWRECAMGRTSVGTEEKGRGSGRSKGRDDVQRKIIKTKCLVTGVCWAVWK